MLTFGRAELHRDSILTNPTVFLLVAITQRFFARAETLLQIFHANVAARDFDHFAVNADPAFLPWLAVSLRFFRRGITLTAALATIGLAHLDDFAVDAAPAFLLRLAIPLRFLARGVTLTAALTALLFGQLDHFTVDATPARRRFTPAFGRTRQRRPPTMGRRGRTGRMITGSAVPFVTSTTGLPPPATALLNPNPLTANILPLPTIDRRWRKQECVLLAVGR